MASPVKELRESILNVYGPPRQPVVGRLVLLGTAIGLIFAGAHLKSPIQNVKWINGMAKGLTKYWSNRPSGWFSRDWWGPRHFLPLEKR